MGNTNDPARRRAVWQIIRSRGTDDEKIKALTELHHMTRRSAYRRGYFAARRQSAMRAGKLRPIGAGGTGR